MPFHTNTFSVKAEDWKPEAVDRRALRLANASEVRDAVSDSIFGNRPFMLDFRNEKGVFVAQMVASGAYMSAAPLNETGNWVSVGYLSPGKPEEPFGPYPDRKSCDYRAGNDDAWINKNNPHARFHMDSPNIKHVMIQVPSEKDDLPETMEFLTVKLLEQVSDENNSSNT